MNPNKAFYLIASIGVFVVLLISNPLALIILVGCLGGLAILLAVIEHVFAARTGEEPPTR